MKTWSLKAKMMLIGFINLAVITVATLVFFGELSRIKKKTEASYSVLNLLTATSKNFDEMTIGMRGFILDSKRKVEWDMKLKADDQAGANLDKAKAASISPSVTAMLEELNKFDSGTMNPLENEFGELVKQGKNAKAQEFYFAKYLPVREKMDQMLEKAKDSASAELDAFQSHQSNVIYFGGVIFFLVTSLSLALSFFFNKRMAEKVTGSIESVADQLNTSVLSIEIASKNTAATSQQIATSATENASAITETLSISEAGKKEAERGKSVVSRMSSAMGEVYEANTRLEQLIQVIEDIQGKTKVINDIVFETRLLSFNASIEAARAGSHGKGFAVVAEEVGKLASVSGKAAEEINALLANSTHQVKDMVSTIGQRVTVARDTAQQCEQVFVQMNHSMAEINSAMLEMEKETHENSASSEEMATQAQTLALESKSLASLLSRLKRLISGQDASDSSHDSGSFGRSGGFEEYSAAPSKPTLVQESSSTKGEVDRSDVRWKAS